MRIGKLKVAVAVAAFASCMTSMTAGAAETVQVTVRATVNGVCKFNSGQVPTVTVANSGAEIDPSSGTTATGNANITYRCTKGTAPTFTVPATATITCTSASCNSTTMVAAMSSTNTGAGAGFTTDQTLTVTGTILPAGFQDAQAGTYSGSINVTVAP